MYVAQSIYARSLIPPEAHPDTFLNTRVQHKQ